MPGVVDVITHQDIPGKKVRTFCGLDEELLAQEEVLHHCDDQPIRDLVINIPDEYEISQLEIWLLISLINTSIPMAFFCGVLTKDSKECCLIVFGVDTVLYCTILYI